MCLSCKKNNYSVRSDCLFCHSSKVTIEESSPKEESKWKCTKCYASNRPDAKVCYKCNNSNTSIPSQQTPEFGNADSARQRILLENQFVEHAKQLKVQFKLNLVNGFVIVGKKIQIFENIVSDAMRTENCQKDQLYHLQNINNYYLEKYIIIILMNNKSNIWSLCCWKPTSYCRKPLYCCITSKKY